MPVDSMTNSQPWLPHGKSAGLLLEGETKSKGKLGGNLSKQNSLCVNFDGLPVDDQIVTVYCHCSLESAVGRIVLEQISL